MYESPIEMVINQAQEAFEMDVLNNTMKVCQQYAINVNPEELKKALAYDRGQYQKGYEDAKSTFYKKGHWEPILCGDRYRCSCCKSVSNLVVGAYGIVIDGLSPFCPDCGADLREEEGNDNG